RFACPVATEQPKDLAALHAQTHALQGRLPLPAQPAFYIGLRKVASINRRLIGHVVVPRQCVAPARTSASLPKEFTTISRYKFQPETRAYFGVAKGSASAAGAGFAAGAPNGSTVGPA